MMDDLAVQNGFRPRQGMVETMDGCLRFDYRQFNRENLVRILARFGTPEKLKVLYLSTYDPRYTRTETLLALFAEVGVQVKTALVGGTRLKYVRALRDLLREQGDCDLVCIGFRGQEILPALRPFVRKPLVFDAFVSVYDTLCGDRAIFRSTGLTGRGLRAYDRALCRMADVVLVDTRVHRDYFEMQFGARNVEYLYVGCNVNLFRPMHAARETDAVTVFWYGWANPLQGVDVILHAAKLLEGENIRFRLAGPVRRRYVGLLDELRLCNVDLVDFVPYEQLPKEINRADLCLGGHFGGNDKARRVIAGKTFQFLACARPTIVGDNSANHELFAEGGLVRFAPMNDPEALAKGIREVAGK